MLQHAMLRGALAATAFSLLAAPALAAPARSPAYVDASAYLQTDAGIEAWWTLRHNLGRNFDEICGDTFCEGDYSNIESLRYVCSVHQASGRIGMCGWTFAASDEMVEPLGGRIAARTHGWFCRSPIAAGTTIESLLDALQGEEPLYAALPSGTTTLFDGLVDCL
ncbi:MAG TPA: hypothetical protein VM619_01020 [Luteimonas sp.]|nr:hypothetical protein [Luteimonas sp.]